MKHVYCIRNNITKTFAPFEFRADDFQSYTKMLADYVFLYPDKAQAAWLHISTLHHIGLYDEEKGVILFDNPDQSPGKSYNIQEAWDQIQALKERVNAGTNQPKGDN